MNRADLRTKIREILRAFYDTDTVGTGGIDASAFTLPVTNPLRHRIGEIITVESEIMLVEAIDTDASTLTVVRGVYESTAAAHAVSTSIKIIPEFTDRAINQAIDFAIGDTFDGYAGIWFETIDETLTTSIVAGTTGREYSIPAGLAEIARIQVLSADNHYEDNRDWEIIGSKIQFKKDFSESGKTIRLIGTSFQALLTDDTTDLDLADEQAQYVIYDAAFFALQQRFAERLRTTQYSAAVNERAGQPIEIVNMVNSLKNTVLGIRQREFKPRMSRYATRPRR